MKGTSIKGLPKFYQEVLDFWQEIKPEISPVDQILWNNQRININCIPLFYKQWMEKGIIFLKDVLDGRGNIMTADEIKDKYGIQMNFLDYASIVKAIPQEWKHWARENVKCIDMRSRDCNRLSFVINGEEINVNYAKCKDYYKILVKMRAEKPIALEKWLEKGYSCEEVNTSFLRAKQLTSNTSLQQFYYFLVHRVIPTRKYLFQQKVQDITSDKCEYCNEIDTIEHAFFECPVVLKLWCKMQKWLRSNSDFVLKLSVNNILFLSDGNNTENIIRLSILYYIYKCRINGNTLLYLGAINDLKQLICVDYFIARKEQAMEWFSKRWKCIADTVDMKLLSEEYDASV